MSDPSPPDHVVDARGHRCPTPTLRLRRALERAGPGEVVELVADDPLARIDVPHFLASSGHVLEARSEAGSATRFRVRKRGTAADGPG
jgi:tRNA 2-thiouridine synthesizing protein A